MQGWIIDTSHGCPGARMKGIRTKAQQHDNGDRGYQITDDFTFLMCLLLQVFYSAHEQCLNTVGTIWEFYTDVSTFLICISCMVPDSSEMDAGHFEPY